MQEPRLFSESVAANIAYGLEEGMARAEVEEAAALANAHAFIQALPQGYDTLVGSLPTQFLRHRGSATPSHLPHQTYAFV